MAISIDQLPDDTQALKQIIAAMAQDAVNAQAEIAKLTFQLARHRRAEFGRSSEKLAPGQSDRAEQLELAIEALETDRAERIAAASPVGASMIETAVESRKPARRPVTRTLATRGQGACRTVPLPDLRRRAAPARRQCLADRQGAARPHRPALPGRRNHQRRSPR